MGRTGRWTRCASAEEFDDSPGAHCYDVYAGSDGIEQIMQAEPGTYLVTDFLVVHRTVDGRTRPGPPPDLRDDYFGNYRRVVWLATRMDDAELTALAHEAAQALGLPWKSVRSAGSDWQPLSSRYWSSPARARFPETGVQELVTDISIPRPRPRSPSPTRRIGRFGA